MNSNRQTQRHFKIKLSKDNERIWKAARRKGLMYKGGPMRLSVDFSADTLQARRQWDDIFKGYKKETC